MADCTRSRAAMISRISPPPIWKSLTVIPRALKIVVPRNRKSRATPPPVHTAWWAIFRLRSAGTPAPIARKTPASPIGSIATNSGMNDRMNLSRTGSMGPTIARPEARGKP